MNVLGLVCFSLGVGLCGTVPAWSTPVSDGPVTTERDPHGFYGIAWGAPITETPELALIESSGKLQTYEARTTPPRVGEIAVDLLRFVTLEGRFARAYFRYTSQQTHTRILAYLAQHFGPADRTPGSMMRGLNQQFTWRGPDTEVNLTYRSYDERGTVFIESRTLAPRFNDVLPDSAF